MSLEAAQRRNCAVHQTFRDLATTRGSFGDRRVTGVIVKLGFPAECRRVVPYPGVERPLRPSRRPSGQNRQPANDCPVLVGSYSPRPRRRSDLNAAASSTGTASGIGERS